MKTRASALCLVVVVLSLFAACSPGAPPRTAGSGQPMPPFEGEPPAEPYIFEGEPGTYGGVLVTSAISDPRSFNPITASETSTTAISGPPSGSQRREYITTWSPSASRWWISTCIPASGTSAAPTAASHSSLVDVVGPGLWWTKSGHRVRIPAWAAPAAALTTLVLATLTPPLLPYALVHNGLLSPLLAVVLVGLADSRGFASRALSTRPLVAIGEAGFAIYVLQWPVWFAVERVAIAAGIDTLTGTWFVAMFATHVALCLAWVRWAEKPLRRALRAGFEDLAARWRPALSAPGP